MHFKILTLAIALTFITAIPSFSSLKSLVDEEFKGQTPTKRHKASVNDQIEVILQQELDFQTALKSYSKAAKAGDENALYHLGLAHLEHFNDEDRYIKTFALLTEAARKKHALAAYQLALMYEQGLGTDRNPKMAVFGYALAASKELDAAQYKLALIYLEERHRHEYYTMAVNLLKKAASQNHAEAKQVLENLKNEIWDSLKLDL